MSAPSSSGRNSSGGSHHHAAIDPGGLSSASGVEMLTREEPGGTAPPIHASPRQPSRHNIKPPTPTELKQSIPAGPPPPPPPPPPPSYNKKSSRSRSRSRSSRESYSLHAISSSSTFHSTDPPSSTSPNKKPLSPPSTSNPRTSPKEPSPTHAAQLEQQQEASPTFQKSQPASPQTAKTEESASSKSFVSHPERRRRPLADQASQASVTSLDPPTGRDHQGRVAMAATPTGAINDNSPPETPTGASQAHYDEITYAAALLLGPTPSTTRTHIELQSRGALLPTSTSYRPNTTVPKTSALSSASPTASSLATEPRSNAHSHSNSAQNPSKPGNALPRTIIGNKEAASTGARSGVNSTANSETQSSRSQGRRRLRNQHDSNLPSGNDKPYAPSAVREKPDTASVLTQAPSEAPRQQEPSQVGSRETQPTVVRQELPLSLEREQLRDAAPSVVSVNNAEENTESATNTKKKKGFFGKIFKRGRGRKKKRNGKNATSVQTVPSVVVTESHKREERQLPQEPTLSNATSQEDTTIKSGSAETSTSRPPPVSGTAAAQGVENARPDSRDNDGFIEPRAITPTKSSSPTSNKNRPEISFLQDDVSTLTGPTLHSDSQRRKDPLEANANKESAVTEPVGHYFNFELGGEQSTDITQRPSIDPFEEPFFLPQEDQLSPTSEETDTTTETLPTREDAITMASEEAASPVTTKSQKSIASNLRINTTVPKVSSFEPAASMDDPMGEFATQHSTSKFHDPSPRGNSTPRATKYPDPFGESPLHKMQRGPVGVVGGLADLVPDPPFFLSLVPSHDSSEGDGGGKSEEKKTDTDDGEALGLLPYSSPELLGDGHVGAVHPTASELSVPAYAAQSPIHASVPTESRQISERPARPPPPPKTLGKGTGSHVSQLPVRQVLDDLPVPTQRASDVVEMKREHKQAKGNRFETQDACRESKSAQEQVTKRSALPGTRQKPRPENNIDRISFVNVSSEHFAGAPEKLHAVSKPTEQTKGGIQASLAVKPGVILSPHSPSTVSPASDHSIYDGDTGERISYRRHVKPRRSPRHRRLVNARKSVQDEEIHVTGSTSLPQTTKDDSSGGKKLMISSMARMNAKAVAYLHTLNGEPSPRNAWHKPTISLDEDATPASQARGRSSFASAATDMSSPKKDDEASRKFFRAYSGKFKGRKLSSKMLTPRSRSMIIAKKEVRFTDKVALARYPVPTPMNRNVEITGEVVSMGFAAFRYRREINILAGKSRRVILKKTVENPVQPQPLVVEPEPQDPIQRAGRRLLGKASIPIQACARRYLAQKLAVDRMWALIEIQSFMRRWRAEAHLLACSLAATTIQRMVRGHHAKRYLSVAIRATTSIQRIVRGHLASAWAFDTVYAAIVIESLARRFLAQRNLSKKSHAVILWQTARRGYVQRKTFNMKRDASIQLQAFWRSHIASVRFKFALADIIVAQSVVRSWLARRIAYSRRKTLESESSVFIQKMWRGHREVTSYMHYRNARTIQSLCRGFVVLTNYKRIRAASKIQSAWRGFQGYTDYIFYLVDVLLVQRVARRWLAIQEAKRRRMDVAASKIQTLRRTYDARCGFVQALADIIRSQSVVRRYLAQSVTYQRKMEQFEEDNAATRIQAAWRGFLSYSHFVIMQFEVAKLQSLARGVLVRKHQQFQLGCCIQIQAAVRRHLARHCVHEMAVERVFTISRATEMRERLSAERIQFWWSVVMECRKEKEAALVIERFFLVVKEEVEKEIRRQEKRKQEKRERRRQKKIKNQDDRVLERVWLSTVEDGQVDMIAVSSSQSTATSPDSAFSDGTRKSGMQASGFHILSPAVRHESSSPSIEMVMRHESSESNRGGEVQNGLIITDTKHTQPSKKPKPISTTIAQPSPAKSNVPSSAMDSLAFSKSEYSEDSTTPSLALKQKLGLASPVFSAHSGDAKPIDNVRKYINMYGLKSGTQRSTGKSSSAKSSHFFTDEEDPEGAQVKPQISSATGASSSREVKNDSSAKTSQPSVVQGSSNGSGKLSINRSDNYQKALLAAAKASISKEKPATSPSPRHGRMFVMNRYQRDKPSMPSNVSRSDDASFLPGEEFGMI